MNTLSVKIRYRPVRIGWCIQLNDLIAFREAVKTNYAIWAGRLNPLIPVYNERLASSLVDLFRVDVLLPASRNDSQVKDFISKYKHLPDPFHRDGIFVDYYGDRKGPQLLDIEHPVERYYREHVKYNPNPEVGAQLYRWDEEDPLADALLCLLGGFPAVEEAGVDYIQLVTTGLNAQSITVPLGANIPFIDPKKWTIPSLNLLFTEEHYVVRNYWTYPGFYFGSASSFDDLITFWNIRATGISLSFFDPKFAERLKDRSAHWIALLKEKPSDSHRSVPVHVWHHGDETPELKEFAKGLGMIRTDRMLWNGLNLKSPYVYFSGDSSALASVDENRDGIPRITFQLPKKPIQQEADVYHQHLVVAVNPGIGLFGNERATLHTPYIGRLNEYYGRNCYFEWSRARVEPDGLGIIIEATRDDLSLTALSVADLITKLFSLAGIKSVPNKPGLIATRLIQQMGDIQGCRVFKIAGVRSLIENYGPDQNFTRSGAIEAIRAVGSEHPISSYDWLYIEPYKSAAQLKGDGVFAHLLRKNLFRAGLRFDCPACKLEFWISLDETRTRTVCEYCGHRFNVTPFLRDRDWAFRRSGLFGRKDNQEGAIPVAMTLQQLDTVFSHGLLYTTAMTLTSPTRAISDCETDFVAVIQKPIDHKIAIAIGECKTRMEITTKDMDNLSAVADVLSAEGFEPYIVLSKLVSFSREEIEHARSLNTPVILLSHKELEPYHLYDNYTDELGSDRIVTTFADMVRATQKIYFRTPQGGDDT